MSRYISKGKFEAALAYGRESVSPQASDTVLVVVNGEVKQATVSSIVSSAVSTDLSYVANPSGGTVTSSTGTNAALLLADSTNAGLLRPADFDKLDVITSVTTFGAAILDDADATAVRTTLELGTAAVEDVGTSANNVVQLDGTGKLPAVDGSLLTNLPAGFADPMTTRGDLIYRNASNTTARLPIGAAGQVLGSDGTDITWTTISGAGDVIKIGTPADNQIGVWTGNGTIEGSVGFTYDSTSSTLSVPVSGKLNVGPINILSDAAGVTSLNNIDAINTVTKDALEATLELPNQQGVLNVAQGGTSFASYTAGDLIYATGATTLTKLGIGTAGQFLTTTDGTTISWGVPAGAGDVLKVGTPIDNQIGVWTGDGTIEGTTSFTFNGATNTLNIGTSGKLSIDGTLIIDDTTGTTTLKNIDAIDTVTEAAIEAVVDIGELQGTLSETKGGTGKTTYAVGDVLIADSTSTLARLPVGTNGQVLKSNGTTVVWGSIGSGLQVLDEAISLTTGATSMNFVGDAVAATNVGDAVTVTINNAVTTVNTQSGAVVLDADDISDAATTNKFTTAADISKLAGIEANADITDTANVTAAGALMDSEVSSLSGIKTLTVPDNTIISAFGSTLVDDTSASAARTTLGLGTAATLNVGTDANEIVQLDGSSRLPAVDGSLLTNLPSGFADPMTTRGDLIVRDASNSTNRLPIGTNGQVLGSNGSDVVWITPSDGITNLGYTASPTNGVVTSDTGTNATIPLATGINAGLLAPGDFTTLGYITATGAVNLDNLGTAAFIDVGTGANEVVQLDGTGRLPAVDGSQLTNLPAGFADPMTTAGDIIIRNGGNTTTRLGVGSEGEVLTVSSGVPAWAAASGGGGLSIAYHNTSTLSPTDQTVYQLDTGSTAITVTLPSAPANGTWYGFCDYDGTFATNAVTINRSGTDTIINGTDTSITLGSNFSNLWLAYYSGNWSVISAESFVDAGGGQPITNPVSALTWSSGATMDNGSYNIFSVSVGANGTLAHSNVPSGVEYSFRLYLTWTAGSITWPTSWTKGMNAPTATGDYIISGTTIDGGTSFTITVTYQ